MKYREYFKIDPEYFPQATEELINKGKVDWKKYYPHETFVKLVNNTISVLTRQQKLSLWVEGAYGTGKSHAVLTLQKLLEESEEETKAYFEKYNSFLSNDLYSKLQGIKSQGKIVIARRYGSSSVNGDNDLIFCIQESLIAALRKNNIADIGSGVMRESITEWLSNDSNKVFFNSVISKEEYKSLFNGEDAESIKNKLETYSEVSLLQLMKKIHKISDELPRTVFKIDMDKLIVWIKDIIKNNNIKAIFFVWDEFTNYFENNLKHLTEFQKLLEISLSNPFYMCIVTHKSDGLFSDTDNDRKRILDRFVKPTCKIELPENMAFRLMAQAMEKNQDPDILKTWKMYAEDLNGRMNDCRNRVKESAKITEQELMNILPIHPYSALILKHISAAFDSNQRSMFEFIKDDKGNEIKGFQWFIDNFGPEDEDPLLTIDMLWEFFYEKGKDYIAQNIRTILDTYNRQNLKLLSEEEKKVLKTVLLMQSISQRMGDSVDIFIPNDANINYAYEGTELEGGMAGNLANKLCKDEILYKKPMGAGKFQYSAMINIGDSASIEKLKEEIKNQKKTRDFINEGEMSDILNLNGALSLRYAVDVVSTEDFTRKINELRNKESKFSNKILTLITFSKNEEEAASLTKQISYAIKSNTYDIIFIDTSITLLGNDALEQYVENTANSRYYRGKDNALANQYEVMAKEILKKWKDKILRNEFLIYSNNIKEGLRLSTIEELYSELRIINKRIYPDGIEQFNVIDNMFSLNSLKSGAECGITEKTSGTFRSANINTKLETALEGAWEIKEYWNNPDSSFKNPFIKKIKIYIDNLIKDGFEKDGQISISKIYDSLTEAPYGFIPCNLTAFVLGFLLKEYSNDTYRWNDGQTSDTMSVTKMKEMIDEIIKLQITPNLKYRDKYIVALTKEEKMFSEVTSQVFNIPINFCVSIQQTRDRIRVEMKKLQFPFWSLKYVTKEIDLSTDIDLINRIVDEFSGIANTNNISGRRTESDIALSIGKICIENDLVLKDLLLLVNKENCRTGMLNYAKNYNDSQLYKIALEIGVENNFLSDLKEKLDADAANWVWNIETTNQRIDDLILEYEIIKESNKLTSKSKTFYEMLQSWCDKISVLKISYESVKNSCDDIKPLLEILLNIKKMGTIHESQKQNFLNLLRLKQNELKNFFANQFDIFKNICNFELFGLSEVEKNEVFQSISTGMFTKEKAEFNKIVSFTVNEYKNSQENRKLKEFWKNKTGTSSPIEWSAKNRTPILCMVPLEEINKAKIAFNTVNRAKPEKNDVQNAMSYFEKTSLFQELNNQDRQNEMFEKHIVKNYSTMLKDINEVRDFLTERLGAEVYDWHGSLEVENLLRQLAEKKYEMEGNIKALQIIEEMDEITVKSYLKKMIKENITVGMEIIKSKVGR